MHDLHDDRHLDLRELFLVAEIEVVARKLVDDFLLLEPLLLVPASVLDAVEDMRGLEPLRYDLVHGVLGRGREAPHQAS